MAEENREKRRARALLARAAGVAVVLGVAIGVAIVLDGQPGGGTGAPAADAGAPDGGNPPTGTLGVEVVDAAGVAIAGARLTLTAGTSTHEATTNDQGQGNFRDIPLGSGAVVAVAPGHARGRASVTIVTAGAVARLALGPAQGLRGRVLDEAGAAVSGALVEVLSGNHLRGQGAETGPAAEDQAPLWSAETDEAGDFAFDDLEVGPQTVIVTAAGFDRIARRVTPQAVPLRIVLRQTAVIHGVVTGVGGEARPDAEVVLAGSGVWPPRSSRTGPGGVYRFTGVPEGVYEVRASQGDDVAAPREGLLLAPGEERRVDLALEAGAALAGVVVAEEGGAPVAGAEVIVGEDALSFSPRAVRTADDGSFRITGLRPRPHRVSVVAEGFVSAGEAMHVPGGEPLRLVLGAAGSVAGRIVDSLGHPVAGATVEVVGTAQNGTPVAASGDGASFQAAHARSLEAGPEGVGAGGELGVTLGAVPLIPLVPTALAPAAAATEGSATFSSDEAGRFLVGGLPAGQYEVLARHPDHAPGVSASFALAAGGAAEDIEVELPAGARVDGRVVDGREFPVADVRVEMHCEREAAARWALTAADGTFAFTGALDRCVFSAYPAALPAARLTLVAVAGTNLPVELALDEDVVTLYARIVDDADFPIAGGRLTLRSLRPDAPAQRSAFSGDDGTVTIGGLPAPPWRLVVDQEGYALETVDLRAGRDGRTGQTVERDITLRPAASIVGRVVDGWDGEPLPGARVEVRRRDATRLDADTTDDAGLFELSRVPAGNYTLHIEHDGLLPHEQSVRLVARRPSIEDLDLEDIALSAGGSVRGEVVDALGAPVPGAEVAGAAAGSPLSWNASVRTDSAGAFVLDGLAPGETVVGARHGSAGGAEQRRVRVRPREETPVPALHLSGRYDPEATGTGEGGTRQRNGVAVRLRQARGRVVIASVLPQTYAEGMGLRARDVVLSVDGEAVADVDQAEALLRGPPDTEALVEVRRRGTTLLLAINRESYQD